MDAEMWFYEYEGRKVGPIPAETLLHLARHGVIHRQSCVWRVALSAPIVAETVDGLFDSTDGSSSHLSEPSVIEDSFLDLEDGIRLPSDSESNFVAQIGEPYAFPDSDFCDTDSTIDWEQYPSIWRAITPEPLDDYTRALRLFQLCEDAIEKVVAKSSEEISPLESAKVMLEQDLLFLASAMTKSFRQYHGLPIVSVEQVWGTLRGEPDTLCLNPRGITFDTDEKAVTGTAHNGEDWSVALDKPCRSVQYLSQHDRNHGGILGDDFIAFASDFCDLLISHWHLPSDTSENRKERLMEWLKDSCRGIHDGQ